MSSDEDEPAPSPSAAVVARRASREAKSMREESGSDEDAEEPEDWEDDGEASSEEGEGVEEVRVSNAQRGRVRLHRVSQSANGLEVDDDRRKSLGESPRSTPPLCVRVAVQGPLEISNRPSSKGGDARINGRNERVGGMILPSPILQQIEPNHDLRLDERLIALALAHEELQALAAA